MIKIKSCEHMSGEHFSSEHMSAHPNRGQMLPLTDALLRQSGCLELTTVPKTVVNSDTVTVFKSRPKTLLFARAFSLPFSH